MPTREEKEARARSATVYQAGAMRSRLRMVTTLEPATIDKIDREAKRVGLSRSAWLEKVIMKRTRARRPDEQNLPATVRLSSRNALNISKEASVLLRREAMERNLPPREFLEVLILSFAKRADVVGHPKRGKAS